MQIVEWVNSRLGKSFSDFNRAKIRLGEFKAVYSTVMYIIKGSITTRGIWKVMHIHPYNFTQ